MCVISRVLCIYFIKYIHIKYIYTYFIIHLFCPNATHTQSHLFSLIIVQLILFNFLSHSFIHSLFSSVSSSCHSLLSFIPCSLLVNYGRQSKFTKGTHLCDQTVAIALKTASLCDFFQAFSKEKKSNYIYYLVASHTIDKIKEKKNPKTILQSLLYSPFMKIVRNKIFCSSKSIDVGFKTG